MTMAMIHTIQNIFIRIYITLLLSNVQKLFHILLCNKQPLACHLYTTIAHSWVCMSTCMPRIIIIIIICVCAVTSRKKAHIHVSFLFVFRLCFVLFQQFHSLTHTPSHTHTHKWTQKLKHRQFLDLCRDANTFF